MPTSARTPIVQALPLTKTLEAHQPVTRTTAGKRRRTLSEFTTTTSAGAPASGIAQRTYSPPVQAWRPAARLLV